MNLDQYRTALAAHDWWYEYSDHHATWERGNEARKALREAQRTLDPLGTIWNEHAPRDHQIISK